MSIPLLFESGEFWNEYLAMGIVIFILAALSIFRRLRWNRDRLFHIQNGRWTVYLVSLILVYVTSVLLASGAVLLVSALDPVREVVELYLWGDMSVSSLARDVYVEAVTGKQKESRLVSRLVLIKKEVENLLPFTVGNKVFLGVFGDEAHVLMPLQLVTPKVFPAFKAELDNLTEKRVSRGKQGTNIGRVLIATVRQIPPVLQEEGRETCVPRVIVILTDGEPVGDSVELSRDLNEGSSRVRRIPCVSVKLVGVGNPNQDAYIPILDEEGNPTSEYETDDKGIIATRPHFAFLGEIAAKLGGDFLAGRSGGELASSLREILTKEKHITGYKPVIKQLPLAWYLALVLLGLLMLVNPFRNPIH